MPVLAAGHAQRHQAEPCPESIAEVVGPGGQHTQRMRQQPYQQKGQDHREIDDQYQAQARILTHEENLIISGSEKLLSFNTDRGPSRSSSAT